MAAHEASGIGAGGTAGLSWRVEFDVPGPPVGKQRARQGWTRGPVPRQIFYTPKGTVDYERRVLARFSAALMTARFQFGVKVSMAPEAKRIEVRCFFRNGHHPDPDNVLKLVIDALKGRAYQKDDRHLASAAVPAIDKGNPRIEVVVEG